LPPTRTEATRLIEAHTGGDQSAAERLLPLVYQDLRALAARYLKGERRGNSLQPTELVHEAYLRLVNQDRVDWRGKTHFHAIAAIQMRRILVEHARAALSQKRGQRPTRVTFDGTLGMTTELSIDFLAIDEALTRLRQRHERQARVAELRLFSGMVIREIAACLGVSERTIRDDWRVARAWIRKEVSLSKGSYP